jgi:transcriptional regulator with XRE-family HTH domain
MTQTTSSALAEYLDREYKKRIIITDRNFSLRQWSDEIGIDPSLLNRMINGKEEGPKQISIEILNKLLDYFGQDILQILGIKVATQPKNPAYGKSINVQADLLGSLAEGKADYQIKKKEGK